jgi:hypothetical protein
MTFYFSLISLHLTNYNAVISVLEAVGFNAELSVVLSSRWL